MDVAGPSLHLAAETPPAPARRVVLSDRACLADAACRKELRAAVREISRLQRGILTAGERAFLELRRPQDVPPDPTASPPTERKAYAPDPVGKVPEHRDTTPPDPAEQVRVIGWFTFDSRGTILDLLA